jgi:hypothetical protein
MSRWRLAIGVAGLVAAAGCDQQAPTGSPASGPPAAAHAPAGPAAAAASPPAKTLSAAEEDAADAAAEAEMERALARAKDAPPPDPDAPPPGTARKKAESGVGAQGQGYGAGLITTPLEVYFRAREQITFNIQVADAMRIYRALHDFKGPKSNDEFMKEIIQANRISLPELPAGHRYFYDPKSEELLVEHPAE